MKISCTSNLLTPIHKLHKLPSVARNISPSSYGFGESINTAELELTRPLLIRRLACAWKDVDTYGVHRSAARDHYTDRSDLIRLCGARHGSNHERS